MAALTRRRRLHTLALSNTLTPTTLTSTSSTPRLFVYGTLQFPDILSRVTSTPSPEANLVPAMTPAVLRGFARRKVRGVRFPAVVREEGGVVEGLLVLGLGERERERVERFEGGLYEREVVEVEVVVKEEGGKEGQRAEEGKGETTTVKVEAEVYVWTAGDEKLADPETEGEWSVEEFLEEEW